MSWSLNAAIGQPSVSIYRRYKSKTCYRRHDAKISLSAYGADSDMSSDEYRAMAEIGGAGGRCWFELNLKEGYGVNIVLIITRRGAPNTADFPLLPSINRRNCAHVTSVTNRWANKRTNGGVWQ